MMTTYWAATGFFLAAGLLAVATIGLWSCSASFSERWHAFVMEWRVGRRPRGRRGKK
ncbi:hypothetical protein ACFY19_20605 [Streptosporangium saharense]|uniref:hypothetical protein n=1 Tax=Streptosporangium saharense TaxID=1706840 RepID=UPI0036B67040